MFIWDLNTEWNLNGLRQLIALECISSRYLLLTFSVETKYNLKDICNLSRLVGIIVAL